MKKALAFFASVTLLLSMMLPTSVYAKTTVEKTHVAGEKTTITVDNLFSRWNSESYGKDSNVKRNGVAYTAYLGSQNNNTNGSVEENYVTVTFPEDGTYTFTFVAHKKAQATVNLMLDDTVIGTHTDNSLFVKADIFTLRNSTDLDNCLFQKTKTVQRFGNVIPMGLTDSLPLYINRLNFLDFIIYSFHNNLILRFLI